MSELGNLRHILFLTSRPRYKSASNTEWLLSTSGLKGLTLLLAPSSFNPFSAGTRPFKPSRCINASFYIPKNRLNFPTTKVFRTKISMKLVYQYITIILNF